MNRVNLLRFKDEPQLAKVYADIDSAHTPLGVADIQLNAFNDVWRKCTCAVAVRNNDGMVCVLSRYHKFYIDTEDLFEAKATTTVENKVKPKPAVLKPSAEFLAKNV